MPSVSEGLRPSDLWQGALPLDLRGVRERLMSNGGVEAPLIISFVICDHWSKKVDPQESQPLGGKSHTESALRYVLVFCCAWFIPSFIPSFLHSFIHSFILNIYKAPFQENYSEALSTPARLKRAVLRWENDAGERFLLKVQSSEGRPFQVEGPTTENAQICFVEVWAKGTRRRPCWDERSGRELIALRWGQQSSWR